jgi:O-antigen/teichoic acid export membrane protein
MLRHILSYFSASVLIFIIGVLLLPVYTRYLTPTDYGILALYILFGHIFSNIISLGFDSANFRYYFKDKSNADIFKVTNSTNFYSLITLLSLGFIFTYFFLNFIDEIIFRNQLPKNIILLSYLFGSFYKIYQFFFKLLIAREKSWTFNKFQLFYFFCCNFFSLYLIIFKSMGFYGKIYGDLFSLIIILIIITYYHRSFLVLRFSKSKFVRSFKYALPLSPNHIIASLNSTLDKYMISFFGNLSLLGTYEIALRLGNFTRIFVDNVTRAWTPYFLKNIENKNQIIVNNFYKIFSILSIFFLICILGSEEAIKILTTPEFFVSIYFVPLILLKIYTSLASQLIYSSQIQYVEKTIFTLPITIIEVLFNLFLNFILIPLYGGFGAAIALLISSIISSILGLSIGQKLCKLNINFFKIGIIFMFLIIITIIHILLLDYNFIYIYKLLIKSIFILIFTILILFMKLINLDDFYYFKKNLTQFIFRI